MMNCFDNLSPRMKACAHKLFLPVVMLLFAGLVLSSFAFAFWYAVSALNIMDKTGESRQIQVSGEGKIFIRPDTALFTATVITQAKRAKDAQDENTRRSNSLLEFLKKNGIAEKDLKTVGYNVFPQYEQIRRPCPMMFGAESYPCPFPESETKILSYRVIHSVEVKIRDLAKADEILDGAIASGANEISSLVFRVDDENAAKEEARRKAIEDAQKKAKILAKDLGVKLGKIISFSENQWGFPVFSRAQGFEAKDAGISGETPQVETGEQEVRSSVMLTFQLK